MGAVRERSIESELQENVCRAQELARDLRTADSAREAFDISRELAQVSKEIERATRIAEEPA